MALVVGACSTTDEDPPDVAATPSATPEESLEPTPSQPPASEPSPEPEPAPTPTPSPLPSVPASRPEVVARVDELLAAAEGELEQATLAVLVTDAHGREVGRRGADASVTPASTLKVVTAASALLAMGPEARLTTRVDATAPIGAGGVLDGELFLVGSGDPTLATPEYGRWIYPARPRTPLEQLADQLVDAGLQRVTGGIRGTAPGFAGPSEASGWLPRYFANFDARYVSGLTVDGGLATSIRWPSLEQERADDLAEAVEAAEPTPSESEAQSAEAPLEPISIPLVGTREEIEGRLAGLDPPLARVEMAPDPRQQAARELSRLLVERGVEVDGEATAAPSARAAEVGLASVDSPPLADVLRFMVQRSDNHLADQLFQVVGHGATGAASWDRAERSVRAILAELGLDLAGTRFADGSGLSRDDQVTPRLLVDLDRAMWAGEHAETWASLQAVAGESGTLRQRLRGTPAAGRLYGKTGTLNDVTALTAAVVGDDGGRYHLAVVGNGAAGGDRWVIRALMDELALVLVADLQGCEVAPVPEASPTADADDADDADAPEGAPSEASEEPETGPLGRPPTVVQC